MDDFDRPHVPVFGYSWVPGRRFAYLAEQRLIVVLIRLTSLGSAADR